ncbi:MAG: 2Fe-2S iron-sulfur cluster-binding protein [Myxococcales bacterium]|nr:(2Fe-2S)-binding protein [Myxococcota bacterium]MDW8283854.1 2Fe-2S iron-sulfur cluster-binding protein [Myxococcales bacterium]
MPVVQLEPFGVAIFCEEGETVFAAARRAGVPIPTACGGRARCGLCRVKVLAGEEGLSALNSDERRHLGNTYYLTRLRLSCQAHVHADVTLLVPDAARRKKR